ncbi:bifunctional tetrahydrofolate synthase/dihydrofolate synthase [Salinisphaera sp.]|uniref:bifunctional tetrahydrofolate synthase/dihydrofolate synthase n=1 Tax=Salinisphaera sp. TaxID=1914330 RepID=UPI002D79DA5A|nr:bifunctional tetrahydrofolate synthase/dihydrofolate synthase [Salinisphaera sp.]HET7314382.1 bifunctional tetrahydrofolate synthase/dihydrofolate synthase [Salinisphaera sp.]
MAGTEARRPAAAQSTLAQWLDYQLAVHPSEIELGLDRVRRVAGRLDLLAPRHRTITVAGTNGKGSTVALVCALIGPRARVGCYTSPHLWRYNERVAIDGEPVADDALVAAFEAIDDARGDISLTFFEFGTLAALWLFARAAVDIAVLEVGLGGRLDAVNIIDADVALITQIGLDHTDWLGGTRAAIGREKAGIMRPGRPVLCGDRHPPDSIAETAADCGARLACLGRAFDLTVENRRWHWSDGHTMFDIAPHPGVHPDNLALAIAGVATAGVDIADADIERACARQAMLPGRREVIDAPIPIIYDVGHNDDAVALLVESLRRRPVVGRTHVVLGMLADKPVEAVGGRLMPIADVLYPAALDGVSPRGLSGGALAARLGHTGPVHAGPAEALAAARDAAGPGDRIVVCGSFFTVAQARSPDHE